MLLSEPQRTNFDLNFKLFGVPVRIHPLFWLVSAIFGWGLTQLDNGLLYFAIFVACLLVSVLIHELGHVAMFRLFGVSSYVVIYSLGGLAVPSGEPRQRWQRILVSAAGPVAELVFFAIVLAVGWVTIPLIENPEIRRPAAYVLQLLFIINMVYGLLNFLPVFPLDGGHISREICTWVSPYGGARFCYGLSFVVAGLIAAYTGLVNFNPALAVWWLPTGGLFTAIMFGMLAFENFQRMQFEEQVRKRWDRDQWDGR